MLEPSLPIPRRAVLLTRANNINQTCSRHGSEFCSLLAAFSPPSVWQWVFLWRSESPFFLTRAPVAINHFVPLSVQFLQLELYILAKKNNNSGLCFLLTLSRAPDAAMLAGVYECLAYTQIISLRFCIFLCIFPTDLPGELTVKTTLSSLPCCSYLSLPKNSRFHPTYLPSNLSPILIFLRLSSAKPRSRHGSSSLGSPSPSRKIQTI